MQAARACRLEHAASGAEEWAWLGERDGWRQVLPG